MKTYVVTDTKGAGRVVGVFVDADRAERIRAIDPNYFRLIALEVDAINPGAVEWLPTQEKREALKSA